MRKLELSALKFNKENGLIPVIIQDMTTGKVLMQAYMNMEAVQQTLETKLVTFFSRSKNRLWTKGEESGHQLHLVSIHPDCDHDSLLVKVHPSGPCCHTGTDTCWEEKNSSDPIYFLNKLTGIIKDRYENPNEKSYTASLFSKGINKVAQKVGEEAIELVIEAKDNNHELFVGEAADLLYHYLVLLQAKEIPLQEIILELEKRHQI